MEQSGEYTYNVIVCRVKFLEETGGTPATSENDQSLLCWVVGELCTRSAFLVSDIIETCPGDDHGADSESADCLESPAPPRNPNLAEQIHRKRVKE